MQHNNSSHFNSSSFNSVNNGSNRGINNSIDNGITGISEALGVSGTAEQWIKFAKQFRVNRYSTIGRDIIMGSSFTHGSEAEWLECAKQIRANFPYARSIMAASFASPLISLLNHGNIFYHSCARTLSGKTAMLRFAMSIWGDPSQIVISYWATNAGIRNHAEMMNPLPVALDSIEVIERKSLLPKWVNELIENYFSTRSRRSATARSTHGLSTHGRDNDSSLAADGASSSQHFWHSCILSTGERAITDVASELKGLKGQKSQKSQKGLKGRPGLLEVKADPLPTTEDGRSFGHALHVIAEDNYGFAGPRFIAFLKDKINTTSRTVDHATDNADNAEQKQISNAVQADYRKMLMQLLQLDSEGDGEGNSKGNSKVSKSRCGDVAVIALADYYASQAVFGVKDEAVAWSEAVELGKQIMTAL